MMMLEGAINFYETDDHIIYTVNSVQAGQYCVVLSKKLDGSLNMLIDLNLKSSFDSLSAGNKTKEVLVGEILEEYSQLKKTYSCGILVFPMLQKSLLKNAIINLDKQKMFDETKKIGTITSELYKKLVSMGVNKSLIDQKIIIVEKDDDDKKFVNWLKEQMPNFVDGFDYFGIATNQESINPFGIVDELKHEENPTEIVENFGQDSDSSENGVVNNLKDDNKTNIDIKEEVTPVNNVNLSNELDNESLSENDENEEKNGSKGFANLLILLVVLSGVIILSIELGKFLYRVYGA